MLPSIDKDLKRRNKLVDHPVYWLMYEYEGKVIEGRRGESVRRVLDRRNRSLHRQPECED